MDILVIRLHREYVEPDTLVMHPTSPTIEKKGPILRTTKSSLHPATAALLGLSSPPAKSAEPVATEPTNEANTLVAELPLTPGALDKNLGIPLIVIVTKVNLNFNASLVSNLQFRYLDFFSLVLHT